MKELELFTANEKEIMRPLLKAKEHGDHEAAIKFTEMQTNGYKRALAEYRKHPENEEVIPSFDDDFMPEFDNVGAKINLLEESIEENEKWLRTARGEENENC